MWGFEVEGEWEGRGGGEDKVDDKGEEDGIWIHSADDILP